MQLAWQQDSSQFALSRIEAGSVWVRQQQFSIPMMVGFALPPLALNAPESNNVLEQISEASFKSLLEAGCELILLGTGAKMKFAPLALRKSLAVRQVALESMDSRAACRTYNVLLGEHRKVGLLLLA